MTRLGRVGGLALVLSALLAASAHARDGQLDLSFGNGGYALTPEPGQMNSMGEIAAAPDGDVFMVGWDSWGSITIPPGAAGSLARFAANGASASFLALVPDATAQDVAVQPDGKVVVAGTRLGRVSEYGPDGEDSIGIFVSRYLPDGSLDTGFGDGGTTEIPLDSSHPYPYLGPRGLDLARDGRMFVGGGNFVARLDQNGTVEQTYTGPDDWEIRAVAAANDGSVIVGGDIVNTGTDWLLRRLTGTLSPDPTFTPPVHGSGGDAVDLAVQSDDRILVLGYDSDGNVLRRLTPSGELDRTFTFAGPAHPDAIALDQQQRILLGSPGLITRLDPDGSLDSSFGSGGMTTEWPPDTAWRNDIAVQPDGGVVVSIAGTPTPNLPCCGEGWPQPFGVARFADTSVDRDTPEVRCRGLRTTIAGTNGSDELVGTGRRDVIAGLSGNDRIRGLARGDVICGGPGDDDIAGGPGRDRLFGGPGADRLGGGRGSDLLRGGRGRNRLSS